MKAEADAMKAAREKRTQSGEVFKLRRASTVTISPGISRRNTGGSSASGATGGAPKK